MDYNAYINSDEWLHKSEQAKRNANYHCQVCYGTERLEAHHNNYNHLGQELPEDITVLCHKCHSLFSLENKRMGWFLEPIDYDHIPPFDTLLMNKLKELGLD